MASTPPPTPVTIGKYLKFKSPAGFRDELIFGKIIMSPEPKPLHYDIAENIYKLLTAATGNKFKVAQRVNLRFPTVASMPSPDVFVTSRAAWTKARESSGYPEGTATILAVEVLSPGNRKSAVQLKIDLYRQYGIEAWVVNPELREIQIYRDNQLFAVNLKAHKSLTLPLRLTGKRIPLSGIFHLSA